VLTAIPLIACSNDAVCRIPLAIFTAPSPKTKNMNKEKSGLSRISYLKVLAAIAIALPLCGFTTSQETPFESNIAKTRYTVLEKVSKSYSSFFGTRGGEISFELIELKNLDTGEIILGAEVNIRSHETRTASTSLAFSSIGSFWGVSTASTYQNIQKSGYIFLSGEDIGEVLTFLNGVLGATGQVQRNFTLYSISLAGRLEFGMMYDPAEPMQNKWSFVFTTEGATYKLPYQDGLSVLTSLNGFYRYILENQAG
jgi:hypothetical protein